MSASRFLFLLVLAPLALQQAPPTKFDDSVYYGSRFRDIKCTNFDNSTGYLTNCFIRFYSRRYVTMNFGYVLKKTLKKPIYVRLVLSYRYGTIYREVLNTSTEWCAMMEGAGSNSLFVEMFKTIEKSAPGLLHKCPYEAGVANFFNISIDESETRKVNIFPEGYYKYSFTIIKRKAIANMLVLFHTSSPLKHSFG